MERAVADHPPVEQDLHAVLARRPARGVEDVELADRLAVRCDALLGLLQHRALVDPAHGQRRPSLPLRHHRRVDRVRRRESAFGGGDQLVGSDGAADLDIAHLQPGLGDRRGRPLGGAAHRSHDEDRQRRRDAHRLSAQYSHGAPRKSLSRRTTGPVGFLYRTGRRNESCCRPSQAAHPSGGTLNEPRTGPADTGRRRSLWWGVLVIAVIAGGLVAYQRRPHGPTAAPAPESAAAPPPAVAPSEVHPWREAARLVEEDRGQAIGRAARVHVPAELRHYANKKRFLALQVAGWMEKDYPIPADEADLARMIDRGDMVEVPAFSKDHVLYGVGANATDEPLAHFDRATGREIPLFSRYDLFEDAAAEWAARAEEKKAAAAAAAAQV